MIRDHKPAHAETGTPPTPTFAPAQASLLRRKCACGGTTDSTGECAECRKKRLGLQRRATNPVGYSSAPSIVHDVLRSPGHPLDTNTRAFVEPRFGHDFSRVRVHADAEAADSARAVNALAYTVGHHVVFGSGQYAPWSSAGRRLLAHELAHVVQQGGSATTPPVQLHVNQVNDRFEKEADGIADSIVSAKSSFRAQLGSASGDVPTEEEIPFTQDIRLPGGSPLRLSSTGTTTLQRAASFVPGPVRSIWNIAARVISGTSQLGFTPPVLNGAQIMSAEQARQAINRPTIARRLPNIQAPSSTSAIGPLTRPPFSPGGDPIHDPLIEEFRRRAGLPPGGIGETGEPVGPSEADIKYRIFEETECQITAVPNNVGSFDMSLPTAGPWRVTTTKANASALMTRIGLTPPAPCSTAGDTTFSINGSPSDADMVANLRTHEQHHATDHERVFNAVLVPWDNALTATLNAGTIFRGDSPTACEAALYRAVGDSPDDIATKLWNAWIGADRVFHATPAGAVARPSNPQANADCSTSSIDVFQP
jgi:hypothetical protein